MTHVFVAKAENTKETVGLKRLNKNDTEIA